MDHKNETYNAARRQFLTRFGTVLGAVAVSGPASAQSTSAPLSLGSLRGGIDMGEYGVRADAADDQSRQFQAMIDAATARGMAVYLPGGIYVLSNIALPDGLVMTGVRGQTRLVHSGVGHFMSAANARQVHLRDLVLTGNRRATHPAFNGLIDCRSVLDFSMQGCIVSGAAQDALYLEQSGGSVSDNTFSDANRFGIFSMEGRGVAIRDNRVERCGNGGIIVHRWQLGSDNSVITGNRVSQISAANGGTGQWGNGINLFRTENAMVANNIIADCAFSSIRANTTKSLTIAQNQCRASGETALYAEFAFQDAIVNGNLIDGATNGISITNFNDGGRSATVSGNIIRNLRVRGSYEPMAPGFGIGIAVEADTTVTGNVIENAEQYGINAGWGHNLRDCVIASNVIRNARIGIGVSATAGAGMALLTGNAINATNGAIIAHEWNTPVSRDLALSGAAAPSNIVLRDNRVT